MSERPDSVEQAVELYLDLRGRGEAPDPSVFAARHPEFEPELSSALDALASLERATRAPEADTFDLPERIGPYRVLHELGRGGMGVVLEAVEEPLGRRVALKVLPPELLASPSARARFRREAELASRLDHSGIATIYGAGVEDDRPWIAMRFVEGETLARAIARARDEGQSGLRLVPGASGREAALAVAACVAQVARALAAAHAQGILHRDVKPSNVVVTPEGAPVLLDFGLAIPEESDGHSLTRTGETAGTPAYLAPEIVGGEVTRPDAQSDVYALGVTLFECLTLRRPFEGPTPVALYRSILTGSAPDARALNRGVPRDLAVVVATAMERDRGRRYRSAAALAEDLEACAAGRPVAARPVPLSGRVLRWARREPRQAVLAALTGCATLAAALFAGTWWASRGEVQAAEQVTSERRYESLLQDGFFRLSTRKAADADAIFQRALELQPGSLEAQAGRVAVRIETRDDAGALELLDTLPSTPALHALREVAARRTPPVDLGAAWLSDASSIELFVDGLRLQKQAERAPRHERPALWSLAAARYTEAVNRAPTARGFYQMQRAFSAEAAGDEATVRSAAAALLHLWGDSPKAVFAAGSVLSRIEPQAAVPLLERSIALDRAWGAPHQLLGNIHYFAGRCDDAARELEDAIRLDPDDADAFNTLGLVYKDLGCIAESRAAHLAAIRLRPRMFEAWANLGTADATRGDAEAAEPELRFALDLAPREPIVRRALAILLDGQGRYEEALHHAEVLVGFTPDDAESWAALGRALLQLGRFEEGVRAIEIGLELAPDSRYLRELHAEGLEFVARHPSGR